VLLHSPSINQVRPGSRRGYTPIISKFLLSRRDSIGVRRYEVLCNDLIEYF
jgi:hypothetical protein